MYRKRERERGSAKEIWGLASNVPSSTVTFNIFIQTSDLSVFTTILLKFYVQSYWLNIVPTY